MSDDRRPRAILIVDENEANSIMAIRLLEEQGYPAVSVRNGLEATGRRALIRWSSWTAR